MKKWLLQFACLFMVATAQAADPNLTVDVWPGTPPGDAGLRIAAEQTRISVPPAKKQKEVFNVSVPTLEIYRPAKDKDTGVTILILPGGGFSVLKMDYEGEDCATWLNTIGVTGIVVKYRVPQRQGAATRYMPVVQDARRAMSVVRSKAKEWNIDPNRIGLLGFSAGGIAVAEAEANFEQRSYEAIDDVDKVSSRPDFAMLIYPGTLVENGKLLDDIHVTKDAPPTFIAIANNDKTENAVLMYTALKQAGVSTELHIYADGEHGFGMVPSTQPHATWINRLTDWMNNQGLLKRN